jgi:hypothetical protein
VKLLPSSDPTEDRSSSAITLDTATVARDGLDIENKRYERYFDRPEVTAAYKKQQLIETPEFLQLSEGATVGSRFRPRVAFEEVRSSSYTPPSRTLTKTLFIYRT